jgi:hypothetical protein
LLETPPASPRLFFLPAKRLETFPAVLHTIEVADAAGEPPIALEARSPAREKDNP